MVIRFTSPCRGDLGYTDLGGIVFGCECSFVCLQYYSKTKTVTATFVRLSD